MVKKQNSVFMLIMRPHIALQFAMAIGSTNREKSTEPHLATAVHRKELPKLHGTMAVEIQRKTSKHCTDMFHPFIDNKSLSNLSSSLISE